jgi:IS5 family transposase
LQHTGRAPEQVIVDLDYGDVDADNPSVPITHRGKYKSLSQTDKRLLRRRQVIELLIGCNEADHRMMRWAMRCICCAVRRATSSVGCCGLTLASA